MTWLVFDFGEKFIGIAVAELTVSNPSPLTTIGAKNGQPNWSELDPVMAEWRPEGVVVGLPLNMDDSESEMSGRARRFAARLGERYQVGVEFADERLTSVEARARTGDRASHAVAAQIIAETWLSTRAKPEA